MEIQKWEYKVLKYSGGLPYNFEQILKECGSEGWELVTSSMDYGFILIFFKRPVSVSKNNSDIKSSYMDYVEMPQGSQEV